MLKPVAVTLAAVALAVGVAWSGALDGLGDADAVRARVLSWGDWGYVLYLLGFTLIQPLGVPGVVFVVPASLLWPLWVAIPLSLAGAVGACVVGFAFARHLGRDWVAARLPARMRSYDERLQARGLRTVILARLIFFLAPPANWVLGLSRVRFLTFVTGTTLGLAPGVVFMTVFGERATMWLADRPAWTPVLVLGPVLVLVGVRRWRGPRPGV
jgi:uncharacterized membrane protein YdjX (TVP38/TMEM64 family)